MNEGWVLVSKSVLIGAGGTAVMDLWMLFMKLGFGIAPIDYARIGRWIGTFPAGRFVHANIDDADRVVGERPLGWTVHYLFGIAMAAILIGYCGTAWTRSPTLAPPLIIGLVTILIPFYVVQPAFGMGFTASKVPNAQFARMRSLMTHVAFGLGLYLTTWLCAAW
ncbi:DUF2938 domain-containing protein [Bradyrhizobium sp. 41S5]|uniref:DUF2938 domain-containing protein n=1 Tax=Bradyrhizobium sp. 41S5 TaxID=1404443 RepID=UPI00156A7742|nr:DUF2938 domain-containing protein [Bradyrhizobium sp. 41S5]UFX42747.1 DUF2938 domain-containing protein [Bradyrhizobium sp. 41S5]